MLTRPLPGDVRNRKDLVAVDSIGPLQITWLLRNESHLHDVESVEKPEIDELRRAGMFDVHTHQQLEKPMMHEVWRRVRKGMPWPKKAEGSDEGVEGGTYLLSISNRSGEQ